MNTDNRSVPDAGPWTARQDAQGQVSIESDDFNHDVVLRVTGDFANGADRLAYGRYIADILTAGCRRAAAHRLPDEGALLATLERMARAQDGAEREVLTRTAEELARMRIALAQAERHLEALGVNRYLRTQARAGAEPSAFARALDEALAKARAA